MKSESGDVCRQKTSGRYMMYHEVEIARKEVLCLHTQIYLLGLKVYSQDEQRGDDMRMEKRRKMLQKEMENTEHYHHHYYTNLPARSRTTLHWCTVHKLL